MIDLLFLLWLLAIGLTIGIVLLPWRKKMKAGGEVSFLIAFTLFWPFLLIGFIWRGFKAYLRAWRRYLHFRASENLEAPSNKKH
jgi:hypothetical protein